jgi:hypothetical protein
MSDGSNYLDPNRPDAVRVSDARALGEAALGRIGLLGCRDRSRCRLIVWCRIMVAVEPRS